MERRTARPIAAHAGQECPGSMHKRLYLHVLRCGSCCGSTGVQVDRDKRGKVIRYTGIKFNNTKWEKMACELKELKEKADR